MLSHETIQELTAELAAIDSHLKLLKKKKVGLKSILATQSIDPQETASETPQNESEKVEENPKNSTVPEEISAVPEEKSAVPDKKPAVPETFDVPLSLRFQFLDSQDNKWKLVQDKKAFVPGIIFRVVNAAGTPVPVHGHKALVVVSLKKSALEAEAYNDKDQQKAQ